MGFSDYPITNPHQARQFLSGLGYIVYTRMGPLDLFECLSEFGLIPCRGTQSPYYYAIKHSPYGGYKGIFGADEIDFTNYARKIAGLEPLTEEGSSW